MVNPQDLGARLRSRFTNRHGLTPSPLWGEGWGEGEPNSVGCTPLTPALSPEGRGSTTELVDSESAGPRVRGESPSPDRFAKSEAVDLSHKGRGEEKKSPRPVVVTPASGS